MKTLMVLRHAKSPHLEEEAEDHDRPLYTHARKEIASLAERLRKSGLVPEVILSSDAVRAAETARAYAGAVAAPGPVLLADLYEPGEPADVLEAVRHGGGDTEVVMVVGHNPGMEDFCNRMASQPAIDHMPTGCVAIFAVTAAAWSELDFGDARLDRVETSH